MPPLSPASNSDSQAVTYAKESNIALNTGENRVNDQVARPKTETPVRKSSADDSQKFALMASGRNSAAGRCLK